MRVHMIGVSGTGMGTLAVLLREAGHAVSGSDLAFDPPMGPMIEQAGVTCLRGFDAGQVGEPELTVVGNAIRRDNPEATIVRERGLAQESMSKTLREHFLRGRRPLVVCGTHGKTTTSALAAWVFTVAEREPGFFIGGLPKNFARGGAMGRARPSLPMAGSGASVRAPFVVEGDEYDAVYWDKKPKFLDYVGIGDDDVVVLTSIEHDHVDIYPDSDAYENAFRALVAAIPPKGSLVCDASSSSVRDVARGSHNTIFYALDGEDTGDVTPTWIAALGPIDASGHQLFDVFGGGMAFGRFALALPGRHNVKNALATIAACTECFGVPVTAVRQALATFRGVRRRQDLLGEPRGIRVYDDFAHHPTAVDETLRALRLRHPEGRLWAVFEPRSATACRSLHQDAYAKAFSSADHVLFAPLGRTNIPTNERLDLAQLTAVIGSRAESMADVGAIVERLVCGAAAGDTIALLSNGVFGGIHQTLLQRLGSG